jgi:hypothetical protein
MIPRINRKSQIVGVPSPRRLKKDEKKHPDRENTHGQKRAGGKKSKGTHRPYLSHSPPRENDSENDTLQHIDIMV